MFSITALETEESTTVPVLKTSPSIVLPSITIRAPIFFSLILAADFAILDALVRSSSAA